jgi:hypothetical protein
MVGAATVHLRPGSRAPPWETLPVLTLCMVVVVGRFALLN